MKIQCEEFKNQNSSLRTQVNIHENFMFFISSFIVNFFIQIKIQNSNNSLMEMKFEIQMEKKFQDRKVSLDETNAFFQKINEK